MATVAIGVRGMTCDGCVRSVTRALESVPGVEKAVVSLEDNLAVVTYESGRTTENDLRAAIEDAGYDVA